jgi:tripartite-type tricarboxylate transporter receptor subunit TctC
MPYVDAQPSSVRWAALNRRWLLATAALTALSLPLNQAFAQDFPSRPIRIVVPFGAGGGVDIVARTLADSIQKSQGITVIIENRTGAGGNIGSAAVAKAQPDGYTVLMASNSNAVNNQLYKDMPYDASKDLLPITLVGTVPMVMLMNPAVPVRDVPELIRYAKSSTAVNFGSGGSGTGEHLILELFKRQTGAPIVHIPYRGGAAVFSDLISGQTQGRFSNQLAATPFVKSGQLRAIGITGTQRSPQLPDIPTFLEQGVSGLDVYAWWGVMGPAGMPAPVIAKLSQIFNAALQAPDVVERLGSLGARPVGGSPANFQTFFNREVQLWTEVIRDAKITLQ